VEFYQGFRCIKNMFRIYFGQLGQGKTYAMTRQVFSELRQGNDVYLNYFLDVPKYQDQIFYIPSSKIVEVFQSLNYSRKKQKAVVALDEGWILFDSYLSTKMDLAMRVKIASLRKHRIDLLLTTQRVSALHKSARDLVNEFWQVSTLNYFFARGFRFVQYELDGASNLDLQNPMQTEMCFLRKKIADSYDTMQTIDEMFSVSDLALR